MQTNRIAPDDPGETKTMSQADIIDGKAFAAGLRQRIAAQVAKLQSEADLTPGLAVVLVGEDPASSVYVRNKAKQTREVGMNSFEHKLPVETGQEELLALVHRLNEDPAVHGILVQLPLPKQIDDQAVINAIDPAKDVDGFHVINAGRLATGACSRTAWGPFPARTPWWWDGRTSSASPWPSFCCRRVAP
jgi:methylenetetrahydrofolate dehydrogenase (NADP+)/methenyltetrahydrofolate cyclohydrolase